VQNISWVDFLNANKQTRSNTGITFKIVEDWFVKKKEKQQRDIMKEITSLLTKENIAYDINGYPKAPPSFRVWGGGTVEPDNIKKLLPWIDWAYHQVKGNYA
jgi:phosphoserine aminotransferase